MRSAQRRQRRKHRRCLVRAGSVAFAFASAGFRFREICALISSMLSAGPQKMNLMKRTSRVNPGSASHHGSERCFVLQSEFLLQIEGWERDSNKEIKEFLCCEWEVETVLFQSLGRAAPTCASLRAFLPRRFPLCQSFLSVAGFHHIFCPDFCFNMETSC